jgi:hypothetical protein
LIVYGKHLVEIDMQKILKEVNNRDLQSVQRRLTRSRLHPHVSSNTPTCILPIPLPPQNNEFVTTPDDPNLKGLLTQAPAKACTPASFLVVLTLFYAARS